MIRGPSEAGRPPAWPGELMGAWEDFYGEIQSASCISGRSSQLRPRSPPEIPGVAPELLAEDVVALAAGLPGSAPFGVRQVDFAYHAIILSILAGLTLVDARMLMAEPGALAARAAECPCADVRSFFASTRLDGASIDGVRARFDHLLRLPGTRLMLGSKRRSPSWSQLLRENIVLVAVGRAPLGAESIGSFWAGLVTQRVTQAVFAQDPTRPARPTTLIVDEFQEAVGSLPGAAARYQRLLSLARSRGVSLILVTQSLALAGQAAPTLPRVAITNCQNQFIFRTSREDAEAIRHLLPLTGRRFRPPSHPWDPTARSPFLSAAEETEALLLTVLHPDGVMPSLLLDL